ncbi:MAG: hypothetical protein IPL99_04750 [Candidatus Competibacteraceae bacterium]|nr:hypothetical protein [Candidatus Competibacteraceae bacterium]
MPLLSNEYLKQFFLFLENAPAAELQSRREGLLRLLETTQDREFRQNIRWLLRKVDEEILTRFIK